MSPKRIFRLAYHSSISKSSRFRLHQLRDGDAFAELAPVLYEKGYEYGGLLLNLPSDKPMDAPAVDISFLGSSDLLILNTRPPIDDISEYVKHPVRCSYTALEDRIFKALKPRYLARCARTQIILSEEITNQLSLGFKDRANIMFHEFHDCFYAKHRGHSDKFWRRPDQNLTAVYLIQIPALWAGGPGLLTAFGMAGVETLAWNFLLRTRFQNWLESYQFLMAEVLPGRPPEHPVNLSFANDWQVNPVIAIPFSHSIS